MLNILKKTKQRIFNKRIFGFDIETCNKNKTFLMASIIGLNKDNDMYKKVFYNKNELIHELKTNYIFRGSYIFATNLSFDFFGTFFDTKESGNFRTLFRGTDLLYTKTFYSNNGFTAFSGYKKSKASRKSLTFLDSMNYAKLSVSKMGEIIGLGKLEKPYFLGDKPQNQKEWDMLTEYNIRDSMITYKFMCFLIKSFEDLGATFKNTIASTSMALFKNKYLNKDYFQHDENVLIELFNAYYGGRTEAFKRGYFTNVNYYDFNSLYPSVMYDKEFPDPNTLRTTTFNKKDYIIKYEGVSHVDIEIFKSKHPILPVRTDEGKVLFPYGKLSGWWSHLEIREAMKQGAVLLKVYKTYYYKETCRPFKGYVNDLYTKRMEYKQDHNPMELVCKLMLNSLYGKFGQKFLDKQNTIHESAISLKELSSYKSFDRVGDYFIIKQNCKPSAFCIPIWAIYVTAYGRLKLHKEIIKHDPIYVDTDSLITNDTIKTSDKLGDLKLEMEVSEGIVVRPKFYALKEKGKEKGDGYVKIKGLGRRLNYYEFVGLLHMPKISYEKFAKFKESLRRDFIPNEIIQTHKEFSLEDHKRKWSSLSFDYNYFEDSEAIDYDHINDNKIQDLIKSYNGLMTLTGEDTFDKMGFDTTKEEFLKNEIENETKN